MTTAQPETAPWAVGRRPTVRIDTPELSDDLALLTGIHGNLSDALRAAVRQAAATARGELLVLPAHITSRPPTNYTQPTDPIPDHIAVPTATADGRHDLWHDLGVLARAGHTDPADAIRWAVSHAADEVHGRWSTSGQCPTLTPLDTTPSDTPKD